MYHRRSATEQKHTERTSIPAMCAISSGLHKRLFNSNNQIWCDICSKTLLQVHHWAQVLARDTVILIAECADMVKYQISSSTRLGPSNSVANVSILDTAYASGNEAHDNVTVSNFSNILVTYVMSNVVLLPIERHKLISNNGSSWVLFIAHISQDGSRAKIKIITSCFRNYPSKRTCTIRR